MFLILIPFKTVGLVFRVQPFLNYGFFHSLKRDWYKEKIILSLLVICFSDLYYSYFFTLFKYALFYNHSYDFCIAAEFGKKYKIIGLLFLKCYSII